MSLVLMKNLPISGMQFGRAPPKIERFHPSFRMCMEL